MDNLYFYNNFGLKIHKYRDKEQLNSSISKLFKINLINNFSSILCLFNNNNIWNYTFNNSRQILKLIKKKKQIHINGGIYKGQIKHKNNKYYTNVFVKECHILNSDTTMTNNDEYNDYLKYFCKYDINSSSNIETFVLYITSKLYELGISPNFQLFYGFTTVNMKKVSTEILNDGELKNFRNLKKNCKLEIYKKKKDYYLERYNIPCVLLYSEVLKNDLYNYIINRPNILEHEWSCYIFQIIAGLSICQKYFNLYHNDLHLSNIMYNYTKEKYIYYEYNNKIYRIKTYNKILKIIDWGRATYKFNNYEGKNNVYNSNGVAFGQYIFNRINNKGKKEIYSNPSTDLVILGSNLIKQHLFPKKGNLSKLVKHWLKYKNSSINNIEEDTFSIYSIAAKFCENAIPIKQIENIVFNKFIINSSLIKSKDKKIYSI